MKYSARCCMQWLNTRVLNSEFTNSCIATLIAPILCRTTWCNCCGTIFDILCNAKLPSVWPGRLQLEMLAASLSLLPPVMRLSCGRDQSAAWERERGKEEVGVQWRCSTTSLPYQSKLATLYRRDSTVEFVLCTI